MCLNNGRQIIHSFIHSFTPSVIHSGYSTAPLQVHYHSEAILFTALIQATASEGPVEGLYVATRAEFEPTTLRSKPDESTNEPPRPTITIKSDNVCFVIFRSSNSTNYEISLIWKRSRFLSPLPLPQAWKNEEDDAKYICFHTDIVKQKPTSKITSTTNFTSSTPTH